MDLEKVKKDIVSFLEKSPKAVLTGILAVSLFLEDTEEKKLTNSRFALTTYLSVFLHQKARKLHAKTAAKRYVSITGDNKKIVLDLYEKFFIFYFEIYCPALKELINESEIGYVDLKESTDVCKPTAMLLFDKDHPEKGIKMKKRVISNQSKYRKKRIKIARKYIGEMKKRFRGLSAIIGKGSVFEEGDNIITTLSDVDFAVYVRGFSTNEKRNLKKELNAYGEDVFKETGIKMEFLCVGLELIDSLLKRKQYNALVQKLSGVYFYSSKSFEDKLDKLEKVTGKIPRKTYSEFYKSI